MNDAERDNARAITELKGDLKALQERMNTHQATYETALERFESNAAKRETRQLGYTVGAMGVGVAIIAAVIALAALFLQQSSQPMPPVIIQTAPEPAPAEIHAAPEGLPDAAAAETAAEKQPDG